MNAKISQELHLFEWYRALFCANCVTDRLSCQACSALLSQSVKEKEAIFTIQKSHSSNTFPKLDNPLCSGLPPALSTFEQSALGNEKKEALSRENEKNSLLSSSLPTHILLLSTGEQLAAAE